MMKPFTPEQRVASFEAKYRKGRLPHSCWKWLASARGRYGQFTGSSGRMQAHRWAYEHYVGPIPDGAVIDHLCRNRLCVNPDHLEPVTNRENLMRGQGITAKNARKTHCLLGHEFTPENTYVSAGRKDRSRRMCKACHYLHDKKWRDKRAAIRARSES